MWIKEKSHPVRIILQAPNFFSIPLKRVEIERSEVTGRTYFVHKDRIVAVAIRSRDEENAT